MHRCYIEKNRKQNVLKLVEVERIGREGRPVMRRVVRGYMDITPTAEKDLRSQFQHQYSIARKVEEVSY